jgi:hypothetical protein
MNTSKLADFAEITSSVAILITLVFLVVQMQQNTEAIRASGLTATMTADLGGLYEVIDHPDIYLSIVKPELTDTEKMQLWAMMTSFMRLREHDWLQYRNGALDEATWNAYLGSISYMLAYQRTRVWWGNLSYSFDPTFRSRVDELIVGTPVLESLAMITSFD